MCNKLCLHVRSRSLSPPSKSILSPNCLPVTEEIMVSSYSHMQSKTDRRDATPSQACQMSGSRKTFPVSAMPKPVILTVLLLQPAFPKLPSH